MPTRRYPDTLIVLASVLSLALTACLQPGDVDLCDEPVEVAVEALSSFSCAERSDTGYRRGVSFPIRVVEVDGRPVEVRTANAYSVMAEAASRAGVEIRVISGFRTMAEQERLYACRIGGAPGCNLAARPGDSNHQSGSALDLNTRDGRVLTWLNAHGGEYGFSRTVAGEPWHWELTGTPRPGGRCRPGCDAHCEGGRYIVGADCGRGDCGVYGSSCVDDSLGVRCVFGACPARGTDTFCVDDRTIGNCRDGAVSTGDCGAYGASCVDDALGARCVFGACPARGSTTVCLDERTLATCNDGAVTTGDCGAFGSRCADGPDGAHCAFYACPDNGDATVCLDGRTLGTCRDGAITTGDCGAFAAVCSTAGVEATEARCVSAFCVAEPGDVPVAHDTCLPDGRIAHCDENGQPVRPRDCSEGTMCMTSTASDGTPGARCAGPDGEEPPVPTEPEPTEMETEPEYTPEENPEAPGPMPSPMRPTAPISSSCSVGGGASSGSSFALALVLGLLVVTRRRRTR